MRSLHNIISTIIFPKIGKFDWMTEKDIAFMCYLIQGKPIDMLFMMNEQIKEAAKRSRVCLPYGMVFALIFSKFGVNLEREDANR